jgi:predicted carbohydrate-binding protein with CBM5 and CBM33 domain
LGGTPGGVCGSNETFTSGGETVVAHGFVGAPAAGAGTANLTLKPVAGNGLSESGLGVQSNNTSMTCTNPDCEIAPGQSVSATGFGSTVIHDAWRAVACSLGGDGGRRWPERT